MAPNEDVPPEELQRRIEEREKHIAQMQAKLRRTEAFEKRERADKISGTLKLAALGIAAILVLAGGVWGVSKLASLGPAECRFHEHATFRVVVDDRELSFKHNEFDMRGGPMPMRAHLHQPDDAKIHLEGGCADVQTFFSFMKVKVGPDHLKLDDVLHGGRDLRPDANNTLQFYLYHPVAGNWTWEEYPNLLDHQLRDKQKMLVTYGNYTTDELSMFQARVPESS